MCLAKIQAQFLYYTPYLVDLELLHTCVAFAEA